MPHIICYALVVFRQNYSINVLINFCQRSLFLYFRLGDKCKPCKRALRIIILFFFIFDNQYAAQLLTHCGCVRWVVLLPLRGCLGVNGSLTMKDIVSSHIWEQVASQGDFTAWSMAPSPQLTVHGKHLVYITLIHLLYEPKAVIVQYIYRTADSLVLRGSAVSGPIDVHSLQAQRNICFSVTARAADVTAGTNQLSHWDDKKESKCSNLDVRLVFPHVYHLF